MNQEVILFHKSFDTWKSFDFAHCFVGLDTMKDVLGCVSFVVASDGFLMKFELFLVNLRSGPLDRANGFDIFVKVVDNDDVISQGFLDDLHPVSVDNAWSTAMLG